jgi:hypothetical protein
MQLLSLLTILYPSLQAAALRSSTDFSPSSIVAPVAILMFFAGLVFLTGDLYRWHAARKLRRNSDGWRKE